MQVLSLTARAQEELTKPKLASECGGETSGVETSRHRDKELKSNDGCDGRRGLGGWSGRNGERWADLGFEGKRASGKLCLVLRGIARANLPAGNTRSAGRDPRSPACDRGQFSAVAWLPGGARALGHKLGQQRLKGLFSLYGSPDELSGPPLRRIKAANRELAISLKDGKFGAVSNICNHVGGPLGEGRLDGDYIVCPWHHWKFHRCSGVGEPGFEGDRVPAYPVKVENGRVLVNLAAGSKRAKSPHEPHPLSRRVERAAGPCALPVSRRRRWTPQIRASRAPIICSIKH
jgi:nitrite reductase/ring-hydroxylating ferredoxin subunit